MSKSLISVGALLLVGASAGVAHSAPCMDVIITGAQGGPGTYAGQAGSGTLVQYGDDTNECGAVRLQFDAGRGTNQRWSQLNIPPASIRAVFLTHIHSDHSEGLIDILQHRWHFFPTSPKVDIVCSADVPSPLGYVMSCSRFVTHIGDAFLKAGEISQRRAENAQRPEAGPTAMANMMTFEAADQRTVVWSSGDVQVTAIRSTHVPGHASYRIDTPAGSVVIGGDAGSDTLAPPRATSTSDQVERLANGADVIVHSAIHPVMGPQRDSGMPPPIFFRQSTASDLGFMAMRTGAKTLVLTHLIPPPGAARQGAWKVPGGALSENDYITAATTTGFTGTVMVAKDLARLRVKKDEPSALRR